MCLEAPKIAAPVLGGGLNIDPPALPAFAGNVDLCCKRVAFTASLPPILPPLVFNAGTGVALNAALATLQNYLDQLLPDCPLE